MPKSRSQKTTIVIEGDTLRYDENANVYVLEVDGQAPVTLNSELDMIANNYVYTKGTIKITIEAEGQPLP